MIFIKLILAALVTVAQAKVIMTNTVSDEGEVYIKAGDLVFFPNVFWSIINNHYTGLTGAIDVGTGAAFHISSDKVSSGLHFQLTGNVKNAGTINFHSKQSTISPKYNLVGTSFNNLAEAKVFIGGDASAGAPLTYLTYSDFDNQGLLQFYQSRRTTGIVHPGVAGQLIQNGGSICVYNQDYSQRTRIYGSGCIRAQDNAAIKLHEPLRHIDTTQTFVLDTLSSLLQVAGVKPKNPFTVAGYGNGNIIGTELSISKFEYEDDTLTIWTSALIYFKVKIGTGYDVSKFRLVNEKFGAANLNNNGLKYDGPIPSGAITADHCLPCEDAPSIPTSV